MRICICMNGFSEEFSHSFALVFSNMSDSQPEGRKGKLFEKAYQIVQQQDCKTKLKAANILMKKLKKCGITVNEELTEQCP